MISYSLYQNDKKCQNPKCGKPTHRHASAKYCWECAKLMNDLTTQKSNAKRKARKEAELNASKRV